MPRFRSTARLGLHTLEGRDVPAGSITAPPISATGLLTITGDDDANDVQIQVTGSNVVLTSLSGTTLINGSPNPVTLPGVARSIKADFKGGFDEVSIKPDADFVLSGPATFLLGEGDSDLDLVTTGRIALGGLTVTSADGLDAVTVQGGANSTIGTAKFTYGAGGSTTVLDGVAFTGIGGVVLTAGDAITNPNTVTGTNVTVAKTFSANLGNSFPAALDFTGGSLGGLTATGYSVSSVLTGVNVTGNVTFKNGYSADLLARGLTVAKNVTLTAPNPNFAAEDGIAPAATTITGNLTLTGTGWTNVGFATTVTSQVKGSVLVKGGWFNDVFLANEFFKVGKSLSLTLNGGDNVVGLGTGAGLLPVGGNLTIKGGAGNDQFTLDRVLVSGLTLIQTFGGADLLAIETGSTFGLSALKTFTADLGTGDDLVAIAQLPGSTGPVTFTGKATIKGGTGNDTLLLGFAEDPPPPGGVDPNSRVQFGATGNLLDGGLGLDFFDASTAAFNSAGTTVTWN